MGVFNEKGKNKLESTFVKVKESMSPVATAQKLSRVLHQGGANWLPFFFTLKNASKKTYLQTYN